MKEIRAIRIRLQLADRARELAVFNLAIDSKLRGSDLVGLRVYDVVHGSRIAPRAIVIQKKTQRGRCVTQEAQEVDMLKTEVARGKSGRVIIMDSITKVTPEDAGAIVVCASHGGASSGEFALEVPLAAVFFNARQVHGANEVSAGAPCSSRT